jgi:hypothetical protein
VEAPDRFAPWQEPKIREGTRERERGVSRGKVVVEVGRGRNQEADQELLVAGALVWGFFLGRADQLDSDRNRMRANFTAGFLDR